jgi:hypothetical protein
MRLPVIPRALPWALLTFREVCVPAFAFGLILLEAPRRKRNYVITIPPCLVHLSAFMSQRPPQEPAVP